MPSIGPLGHASRIPAAVWCLSCVVFVYVYSGSLVSFVTVIRTRPVAETLEEVSDGADGLQPMIIKSGFFEMLLLVSIISYSLN